MCVCVCAFCCHAVRDAVLPRVPLHSMQEGCKTNTTPKLDRTEHLHRCMHPSVSTCVLVHCTPDVGALDNNTRITLPHGDRDHDRVQCTYTHTCTLNRSWIDPNGREAHGKRGRESKIISMHTHVYVIGQIGRSRGPRCTCTPALSSPCTPHTCIGEERFVCK